MRGGTTDSEEESITTLADLYRDQLRDIYSVECQLVPALSELVSMATSEPLQRCLQQHIEETHRQKERLEAIGREHGWKLDGDPSKGMKGLIDGGHAHISEIAHPPARDFLIVAHTHRVEHYERAAYAVLLTLAARLGLHEDSIHLHSSMSEEQTMDTSLNQLAANELLVLISAK